MVTGMHFRHPAITARMSVSLDLISGGRSYLGLGAGWFEGEAEAHGIELGSIKERLDRFEEGLEVIVSLLTQEVTDFDGAHYKLNGARCEPKPIQRPHPPIAIGGTGRRRTLRSVARWAQLWDSLRTPPGEWRELKEVLAEHCEALGRDPHEITCSAHITWSKDDDPGDLADQAAARFAEGVDLIVFSMASPYHAAMVEPLASALSAL
jgi:alkanesulfonate monooxygenase SsuD/methylene tetrahydromethanopterin reductase-like flavin-dependent oxidoreductase (luciferase family)